MLEATDSFPAPQPLLSPMLPFPLDFHWLLFGLIGYQLELV